MGIPGQFSVTINITERPSASEGRFQKVSHFQCVAVFGRAPFSKVRPTAQSDANIRDGSYVGRYGRILLKNSGLIAR